MKTTTRGWPKKNQITSGMSMKKSPDDALNKDMTHQTPTSPIRNIEHSFHERSNHMPKAAQSRT